MAPREPTTNTRQLYGSLPRHHLEPTFGAVGIAEISPRSYGARSKAQGARGGHGGLNIAPEMIQGQAENRTSGLALSRTERATGIEPA